MVHLPDKITLANLPTRIEKLSATLDNTDSPVLYIKRDDETGMETSGNKIRKLEYTLKEALALGCDSLITCGAIQSNHCRATVAASVKMGLKVCVVLRGDPVSEYDGNLLLDKLLGAEIRFVAPAEYNLRIGGIMKDIKKEMEIKGLKPYVIPSGASNGIGALGYYAAFQEIVNQENAMELHFDCIVVALGSAGTYSGLFLARNVLKDDRTILGISVSDNAAGCKKRIEEILHESTAYLNVGIPYSPDDIKVIDEYVGEGYGLCSRDELRFIADFASTEGIILDPVYTGKAMHGLMTEIKKGSLNVYRNILFIHTGGIFDIFPYKKLFESYVWKAGL
ncbi:MAG TPA: D-cysteine desulfhydrase family protein [Syntrophorhabdaceae bacterium]|nr:D-cysteine desulfhydrase family protein [Syntrophorhabdaceae bacterium]